ADRERTLSALLALSRVLATDLTRDQMLDRICETMGQLIDGAAATAILERRAGEDRADEGDHIAVVCHHGFDGGPRDAHVPAAQASVSLEAAGLFEDIQHERRRLEAVLRAVPIGIAVADADGSDVRLNPAGAALFNLPTDANFADPTTGGAIQRYVDGRPVGR